MGNHKWVLGRNQQALIHFLVLYKRSDEVGVGEIILKYFEEMMFRFQISETMRRHA